MTEPLPVREPVVVYPAVPDQGQDPGLRMLIPVGRCGYAIAAGYLGLAALFPFIGPFFGVPAIITAIMAHRRIRANPNLHGMGRVIFAYIAGVIGILWGILMVGCVLRYWSQSR